jgi:CubicO group peptidase (beta-lactamase class C family)
MGKLEQVRHVSALLLISLLLAACSGQGFPEPIPVASVDLQTLTLEPYLDKTLGLRGVVPAGWVEAYPGAYPGLFLSGSARERPGTVLLQRLEPGLTLEQAKRAWQQREGQSEFPKKAGNRETPNLSWELYTCETETFRGATEVDIALAAARDDVYVVEMWTPADEYEALHEVVFVPAVDALAPAADLPSSYTKYAGWPVVASIQDVGNRARERVEFSLERCTRLRLYAIGEAGKNEMVDWGAVENADTGQVVWRMYPFETESAGYYRNRRVDRPLTLPPGAYRLHFQTNGAHAYGDWGDRPPGHRFWGITLFAEPSSESSPPSCWPRARDPDALGWSPAKLTQFAAELQKQRVAALVVVTDGQVVLEWGNTANNFQAHSMRKSLISALYGIYVAEGRIDLSKTLAELGIDELTPLTDAEKQATVEELLQARSGVYIPAAGEAQSMADDRPARGSHPHGTYWYYNNWDFNALGTIFDQETGEDNIYRAFETRIAAPIGMSDYFSGRLRYTYSYKQSAHPYYGFRISARDLARFGQLYLNRGKWGDSQIVPATWVKSSTRAHSKTRGSGTYSGYGYMWWVAAEDHGAIQKGSYCASGYGGHTVEVLPDLDTVIAIRFNTDAPGFENQAGAAADELISKILETRTDTGSR